MKIVLFIIATFIAGFSLPADSLRLVGVAYLPPTNLEITWSAPTNELPHGLWVYKVIPQDFSMAVISNAMAIGSFQARDIINPRDTNMIHFQDRKDNWRRRLEIVPSEGWIGYLDQWETKEPLKNVPSEDEATKLAMDYLFQLGIDRSQFVRKARINPTTVIRLHQGQKSPEEVVRREVVLNRCIDGVEQTVGSFRITFGNNAKVEAFDLSWRNLQAYESHQLATANEIIGLIKGGQAVIPLPEFDFTQLDQAKKLTIAKITPYYWGEWPSDPQDFVYPFAQLEMTADLGNTNFNFQLRCPILSTNKF
ncbi:MAG TPA: hypothetical protein VGH42_09115 [Verrucomicrobiae bacterium]|jgi:hypothetical protein